MLYIGSSKINSEIESYFSGTVQIRPYEAIHEDSRALGQSLKTASSESDGTTRLPEKKLSISNRASWALSLDLGGEENVEEVRSLIGDAKAVKNKTELEGMRSCHVRDGAALIEYFAWLEEELIVKDSKLDEVQVADKLEQIRS